MNKYNTRILRSKREDVTSFSKRKSYSALTGIFYSTKTFRITYFESSLERDFIYLVEFDRHIINFLDHPFTIEYTINDKTRKYTPDFYVEFDPRYAHKGFEFAGHKSDIGKWVVEIKYSNKIEKFTEDELIKHEAAKEFCEKNGYQFVLIDESIRNTFLDNVKTLHKFRFQGSVDNVRLELKSILSKNKSISIGNLLEQLPDELKGEGIREIWSMISYNHLECDLNLAINKETILKYRL